MSSTTIICEAPGASIAGLNQSPQNEAPSRHSNPFATCWTRPGALAFRFFDGDGRVNADALARKLATENWRGEILGPHGSGKSTLLATLIPCIEATGRRVAAVALRDGQRRLPRELFDWDAVPTRLSSRDPSDSPPIIIIDGYEQLSWFERARLKRHCWRTGSGLLVTSHAPAGLPILIELNPSLAHVHALTSVLCAQSAATISLSDIATSHARCGSNVREIFFELYDRYEELKRRA